jgi:putative selenium metabolism hydrolase
MRINRGQRGRVEFKITLRGQRAHASDPGKGINAIYGINKIIKGIEELNETLPSDKFLGKASIAVTHVECDYNGPNQLPESCHIIVDRRMIPSEKPKKVEQQLKEICKGSKAKIEIVPFDKPSYRGLRLPMEKFFPTWVMPEEHPLIEAAEGAYKSIFKKKAVLDKWTMSTAGVYTMGVAEVPTIGFGPAEESHSGPINDHVRIDELEKTMSFYATLPGYLPYVEPSKIGRRR